MSSSSSFDEEVQRLNAELREWTEGGGLQRVRSADIVPDSHNRERTGLSLEHVHFIAGKIAVEGFTPRAVDGSSGHDLPVLVRESASTSTGASSLRKWRSATEQEPGFPPMRVRDEMFYTSMGNGHFSQALNLFGCGCRSIFTGEVYEVGQDAALREALDRGVPALVLRSATPWQVRRFICEALNRTHTYRWAVDEDTGAVEVCQAPAEAARPTSHFEALSKTLDAEELSALVRIKLKRDVSEDEAQANYARALRSPTKSR
eukprot:CAMPEP_0170144572 /NCGR_PEP_ID=MMETSP0033_2-20121228/14457_1 /TAXON_ID=195969 /ORGANISM="Dolichomastix tenuilepis, Strain CCMP3274" /LENGTH=260 /DNA_ID=CAMNT_0010381081 /DNA_START=98 /DNA_END=877 /DNA_ORIENTATION=-